MTTFLKKIGILALTLVGIFIILNGIHATYNDDPPHYRLQYQEVVKNNGLYNGAIIGTSQATYGIKPSMIDSKNLHFFNFALNGSSPDFYLKWYTHFFTKHHSNIDYWILSADHYFLSGKGWRSLEHDSEYLPDSTYMNLLFKSPDLDKSVLIYNRIPLLKYRSRTKDAIGLKQSKFMYINESYDKGFISIKNRFTKKKLGRSPDFDSKLSENSTNQFIRLIDLISKSGSKILIIIPPEFRLKPEEYKETKLFLNELSDNKKIPLIDFNSSEYTSFFDDESLFVDTNHLSGKGSMILGQLLNQALNRDKSIFR